MVSAISSWAEQIIIAIMIATIFEMIIPDGKNKKYVKTIIGLYILFTILSPVIKNFSSGEISFASSEYSSKLNEISTSYNEFNNVTDSNIKDTYILSLKQDMQSKLNKKGYIASNIKIEVEQKDDTTYGQINKLYMNLSRKPSEDTENTNKNNNNISINKIEIENTKNETTKEEASSITDNEIKELKEYMANEYGIEVNNIKIE